MKKKKKYQSGGLKKTNASVTPNFDVNTSRGMYPGVKFSNTFQNRKGYIEPYGGVNYRMPYQPFMSMEDPVPGAWRVGVGANMGTKNRRGTGAFLNPSVGIEGGKPIVNATAGVYKKPWQDFPFRLEAGVNVNKGGHWPEAAYGPYAGWNLNPKNSFGMKAGLNYSIPHKGAYMTGQFNFPIGTTKKHRSSVFRCGGTLKKHRFGDIIRNNPTLKQFKEDWRGQKGALIGDIGKGVADFALNGVGIDAIGDDAFKTTSAQQINKFMNPINDVRGKMFGLATTLAGLPGMGGVGNKISGAINPGDVPIEVPGEELMMGSENGFQYGGLKNTPYNAELEKEEVFMSPDGKVGKVDGPSHDSGGVPIALQDGTIIFSDYLKNMEGKTFASVASKYKKKLDSFTKNKETGNDITRKTTQVNYDSIHKKLIDLYNEQESLKAENAQPMPDNSMGMENNAETMKYGGLKKYQLAGVKQPDAEDPLGLGDMSLDPFTNHYVMKPWMDPQKTPHNMWTSAQTPWSLPSMKKFAPFQAPPSAGGSGGYGAYGGYGGYGYPPPGQAPAPAPTPAPAATPMTKATVPTIAKPPLAKGLPAGYTPPEIADDSFDPKSLLGYAQYIPRAINAFKKTEWPEGKMVEKNKFKPLSDENTRRELREMNIGSSRGLSSNYAPVDRAMNLGASANLQDTYGKVKEATNTINTRREDVVRNENTAIGMQNAKIDMQNQVYKHMAKGAKEQYVDQLFSDIARDYKMGELEGMQMSRDLESIDLLLQRLPSAYYKDIFEIMSKSELYDSGKLSTLKQKYNQ